MQFSLIEFFFFLKRINLLIIFEIKELKLNKKCETNYPKLVFTTFFLK